MPTPFIKVSTQISEHHKVLRTPRAYRWAYIELLCYAARNLTNGFIPAEYAALVCLPEEVEALASNRLIDASPGGWQIHGYLDWQTDSELIEKRREAGRRGGIKSGQTRRAQSKQNAKQNGPESKQTTHKQSTPEASASNPDELEVEVEVEVEAKQLPSPAVPASGTRKRRDYPPAFEEFWQTFPRRAAKGAAYDAYVKALKLISHADLMAAVVDYANDPNLPTNRTKIPHPATWLNGGRWDDDPLPADVEQRSGPITAYGQVAAAMAAQQITLDTAPVLEIAQ